MYLELSNDMSKIRPLCSLKKSNENSKQFSKKIIVVKSILNKINLANSELLDSIKISFIHHEYYEIKTLHVTIN